MMNKLLLSCISLCIASSVAAQSAVVSAKDKESAKDEPVASYYLPKTVIEIEVETTHKVFKAGPYASDSKKYFGTYANMKDEESWEITEIKIKQRSEPDVNNHYKVYAQYGSSASMLSLTDNGILRGVNLPLNFFPLKEEEKEKDFQSVYANTRKGKKKKGDDTFSSDFISNFLYIENDSAPKMEAPQFAFNKINTLRTAYNDILTQNSDAINGDISPYLKGIEKQEYELAALFFGKKYKETVTKTFIFYPDKEATNQDLFRFSTKGGFDESGDDVTVTIKRRAFSTRISATSGKSGFIYRVPALADMEIKQGKNILWSGIVEISQLGNTESLPAGFFDKNDMKAVFDPKTGALIQISK